MSIRHFIVSALAPVVAFGLVLGGPAVQAEEPVRGGTAVLIVHPEPPILVSPFNSAGPVGQVSTKIHDGLFTYDWDMNPQPRLATSWELSDDGLSLTLKLREGVSWHDGKPFTAADVKFSLENIWKELHPRGRTTFAKVAGVDTPDDLTVVVKMSEPTPQMMSALASYEAQVVPKHIYETGDIVTNPNNVKPIGTGPFIFKEWQRGNFVMLERNPNYWDEGKPYLDRLVVRFIPDAGGRAAALEAGEAHIAAFSPVPLNDVQRLDDLSHLDVETRGYEYFSPVFLMEMNLRNPNLQDRRVRQAIAHAIDRNFVLNNIWFGYGKLATGPIPSALSKFYNADVPVYEFDVDKANALLDEAGMKRGADGTRFKLMHDFLPYGEPFQRTAEYVKQALGKVGIEVEIRSQDVAGFLRRVYTEADYDLTNNFFYAMPDPTIGVQRIYWSKNIKEGVTFSNASTYNNPKMDELLEQAQTENDTAKRKALFDQMQAIAQSDVPVLDVFEMKFLTLYNNKLKRHTLGPEGIYQSFAEVYLEK